MIYIGKLLDVMNQDCINFVLLTIRRAIPLLSHLVYCEALCQTKKKQKLINAISLCKTSSVVGKVRL